MIRLEHVTKTYDRKTAVDDVSLEVPGGSLFGLIGPNGAGKTTTLKILATLVKPDRGRVTIGGHDLATDARLVRRRLGYMPDAFGTFHGLSCEDYLEFFGRVYDLYGPHLRERVDAVLDLTDLGVVRDELTSSLSTGMKQRLSLAKTLLHDPDVLILDEPASGLDPRARIEIRSLLKELGRMGKTIVISSHILADLEEICTAVGILEKGAVVWHGHLRDALGSAKDVPTRIRLRVEETDSERTESVLRELDFITNVERDGDRIEADATAGRTNDTLDALIRSGIEILAFHQAKVDLESIFLHRTRGIVS